MTGVSEEVWRLSGGTKLDGLEKQERAAVTRRGTPIEINLWTGAEARAAGEETACGNQEIGELGEGVRDEVPAESNDVRLAGACCGERSDQDEGGGGVGG